jgi:hypothetical protein
MAWDGEMRRITGIMVGARARPQGGYEAYIYRLTDETCPDGVQFESPDCVKETVRSLDRPVVDVIDYKLALARVILPADAEGIAALEAARPGAIFEIAGSRFTCRLGRGIGDDVEFEDAVVTPLPGPAPREALRALEIPVFQSVALRRGPGVVRGVALTPVREEARFAWFALLNEPDREKIIFIPHGAPVVVRVVLYGRRATDLPSISWGTIVRVAGVRYRDANSRARWYSEAREAMLSHGCSADLPDTTGELYGGPETAVMVV